jgi:hypothetical protein
VKNYVFRILTALIVFIFPDYFFLISFNEVKALPSLKHHLNHYYMYKNTDPNTFTKYCTLFDGDTVIGNISMEYSVMRYDDVQVVDFNSVNKPEVTKFKLHCTQRINIYNVSGLNLNPVLQLNGMSWNDYPALVHPSISMNSNAGLDYKLLDYTPRTINTTVQSTGTTGSANGQTTGTGTSATVGTTTSQTNSYGVNYSSAFGGGGNYENSSTVTNEQSQTQSAENSKNHSIDTSISASMSMKDWGAYSSVDPVNKNLAWIFGQEYPWDAISCRITDGAVNPDNNKQEIVGIPDYMALRLWDGAQLLPPSQLSMFGVDFVMKAMWLVTLNDIDADDITITHNVDYYNASHVLGDLTAEPRAFTYIDSKATVLTVASNESLSTVINLRLMSLDAIGKNANAATIGFIPKKFIFAPPTSVQPYNAFKIISSTNDLYICDSTPSPVSSPGFSCSETSLTCAFSETNTSLQMTLYFKILDSVDDYTFFLKHWVSTGKGVCLTIVINGDTDNELLKYVTSAEAEGGENNLGSISLRNNDFASIDYHDYLQLGLNSIQITITPISAPADGTAYQIRALSIEKI